MRSIWSGSISFGLVNIPVKLYSAHASSHEIDFDMLHSKDLSPVRYARMCEQENSEIPFSEITKGVDTGGGNYVVVSPEELEAALPKKTKTIDIVSFCTASEVDPIYFEKPYFLEADKQSDKPYLLLLHSLESSQKVGIARMVLRNKEHLAILRPYKGILMLIQLRFNDEISDLSSIRYPVKSSISREEKELATKLIEQISQPFDPTKFHDDFTSQIKQVIQDKVRGKEIVPLQDVPMPTEINNLIETLSKSLSKK